MIAVMRIVMPRNTSATRCNMAALRLRLPLPPELSTCSPGRACEESVQPGCTNMWRIEDQVNGPSDAHPPQPECEQPALAEPTGSCSLPSCAAARPAAPPLVSRGAHLRPPQPAPAQPSLHPLRDRLPAA